jgi:16S rRNA processing protein RimM
LIFIGKILKVRGNKGEVVITSPAVGVYASNERENGKEIVILKSEKHTKKIELISLKEINGNPVLKLKGIDSINDALRIVGYSVYIEKSAEGKESDIPGEITGEVPPLEGYAVKDLHGDQWGDVIYFETGSSNKLLEVQGENENDVYYVPFTPSIIKKIDKKKHLIIIDPPDGLKSLNQK